MATTYLKIENRVRETGYVNGLGEKEYDYPPMGYIRMLGASSSRGDSDKIGQFGSGGGFSLAELAREDLLEANDIHKGTKLCVGKDVYTYSLTKNDDPALREIIMKKQNGPTTNLNISKEFGALDWTDVSMAVREFICNAIDASRAIDGTDDHVSVEVVQEKNCRAKEGTVRIYIPMNGNIQDYHTNIGRNLICLNEWYSKEQVLLPNPKKENVRIYRRGVLVGEFGYPGLFHYNLNDVRLNECRIVDESNAKSECAKALAFKATASDLAIYLESLGGADFDDPQTWEHSFYHYYMRLSTNYTLSAKEKDHVKEEWKKATRAALVGTVICSEEHERRVLESKGFNALKVSAELKSVLVETGSVKTAGDVLNENDLQGRIVKNATPTCQRVLNQVWDKMVTLDMTAGKARPEVKVYVQVSEGPGTMRGYYLNNCVYVKEDHADDNGLELQHIIMHELAHHVTDAKDYTPDFQEFVIKLACKLMFSK